MQAPLFPMLFKLWEIFESTRNNSYVPVYAQKVLLIHLSPF